MLRQDQSTETAGADSAYRVALAILRIPIGIFLAFKGLGKLAYLVDSSILAEKLSAWLSAATSLNRWYLEILIPGVPVFARFVVLGELCGGLALIFGFSTRLAALLSTLMILNYHLATGAVFRYDFLTDGSGLPLLGGLVALAMGGIRLPFSATNYLSSRARPSLVKPAMPLTSGPHTKQPQMKTD